MNKTLQIFAVFAAFQDELQEARIMLKLFLQPIGRNRITKYSSKRFHSSRGQKMSKDVFNSILGQIIVSNLTNVHKVKA